MLLQIPNILSAAQIAECGKPLKTAEWSDGKATAGYLSSRVKNNMQLPECTTIPAIRREVPLTSACETAG